MRRHNRMTDEWITLCRVVGWHAQAEPLIFTAQDVCKRTDLVALSPDGIQYACDVMFTAPPPRLNPMLLTWIAWLQPKHDDIIQPRGAAVMSRLSLSLWFMMPSKPSAPARSCSGHPRCPRCSHGLGCPLHPGCYPRSSRCTPCLLFGKCTQRVAIGSRVEGGGVLVWRRTCAVGTMWTCDSTECVCVCSGSSFWPDQVLLGKNLSFDWGWRWW